MTLTVTDLTVGPDDPPKVEVLATGLAVDVATVTAWRLVGGFEQQVSGIINAPVAGAGTWVDYEVPAQSATYRLEQFDDAGVPLGFSESVTVELGFEGCWMHPALAPAAAVRVSLLASAGRSLSRPVPGEIVRPRGRRVGVMVTNPRQGLVGGVFDVYASTIMAADKVQAFLGTASVDIVPVLCIRMGVDHNKFRVQSPLFLGVFDIVEEAVDLRFGGEATIQRIQGDEVARPAPGIFIPLLRRKDLNAFYESRNAINSTYLTRLAANRDYSLAGFAGD